jgi:hypothetical protein
LKLRLKDQTASLKMLAEDPQLKGLQQVKAPRAYPPAGTGIPPRRARLPRSTRCAPTDASPRPRLSSPPPCLASPSASQVKAPLIDLEVRGVPALTYFGSTLWSDEVLAKMDAPLDCEFTAVGHCEVHGLRRARCTHPSLCRPGSMSCDRGRIL